MDRLPDLHPLLLFNITIAILEKVGACVRATMVVFEPREMSARKRCPDAVSKLLHQSSKPRHHFNIALE